MANTIVLNLVGALVACMLLTSPNVEAQVTCNLVASDLSSCLSYLQSGGSVPAPCCKGIKSLYADANTVPARQSACRCIKQLAGSAPGVNLDNASSLAGKCGVSLGYPINAKIDCSKIP